MFRGLLILSLLLAAVAGPLRCRCATSGMDKGDRCCGTKVRATDTGLDGHQVSIREDATSGNSCCSDRKVRTSPEANADAVRSTTWTAPASSASCGCLKLVVSPSLPPTTGDADSGPSSTGSTVIDTFLVTDVFVVPCGSRVTAATSPDCSEQLAFDPQLHCHQLRC